MGTISKGILGGFSGKVGNVIGGTWKGIDYMRSKSSRRNFEASEAQLAQQAKFALTMHFLQPMSALLEIGFRNFAIRKTGINSAFAYTIQNAVTGTFPTYTIDYASVLISRGDLPNALAPSVVSGAASSVTFSWTNNSGVGSAKATDQAILVAYSGDSKQVIYSTAGGLRSGLTGELNLLPFAGLSVQIYIGFISDNGRNLSTSYYLGAVTVTS